MINELRERRSDICAAISPCSVSPTFHKPHIEPRKSLFFSLVESCAKAVNSVIENRGGLAWFVGFFMVPSQFLGPNAAMANRIITHAGKNTHFQMERFRLPIPDSSTSVEGVIYYPKGWDPSHSSRCVIYHNPNAITVAGYFLSEDISRVPEKILKLSKCPIIMYDYRGTGLSSDNRSMGYFAFMPTYKTIVADGEAVLEYALNRFQFVSIAGSSLGGGVATIALDHHLKTHPLDKERVNLLNHDSFSTVPRVLLPKWPRVADWVGWVWGSLLDAETSMKNLVERGIPITILCHEKDPLIPRGARMADFIETLSDRRNVSMIYSHEEGHANLSPDMLGKLTKVNPFKANQ